MAPSLSHIPIKTRAFMLLPMYEEEYMAQNKNKQFASDSVVYETEDGTLYTPNNLENHIVYLKASFSPLTREAFFTAKPLNFKTIDDIKVPLDVVEELKRLYDKHKNVARFGYIIAKDIWFALHKEKNLVIYSHKQALKACKRDKINTEIKNKRRFNRYTALLGED